LSYNSVVCLSYQTAVIWFTALSDWNMRKVTVCQRSQSVENLRCSKEKVLMADFGIWGVPPSFSLSHTHTHIHIHTHVHTHTYIYTHTNTHDCSQRCKIRAVVCQCPLPPVTPTHSHIQHSITLLVLLVLCGWNRCETL